jgi:hypothetical protein
MSTRERVRVMLEWFGRRQTTALPINSVVGCLIATILLMISLENNVRTPWQEVSRRTLSAREWLANGDRWTADVANSGNTNTDKEIRFSLSVAVYAKDDGRRA